MSGMKNRLGDTPWQPPSYPASPGYRGPVGGPSQRAAAAIAGRAKSIRQRVLDAIDGAGASGATSDELMDALALPEIVIRPRVSELRRDGEIVAAGTRRGNSRLGMSVWKRAGPLPNYPHITGKAQP